MSIMSWVDNKLSLSIIKIAENKYVQCSFEALIPLFITITLFSLLDLIPSILPVVFPEGIIDLHTVLQKLFFWLLWIINTLPGVLVMVFIINLLWTVGIHGSAIVEGFTLPVLLQFLDANAHAVLNGEPLPYILTNQFYYSFVWIGGGGATLGLAILMAFVSRSQALKAIGKSSLVPSIFNINEPVVLNPYLMVPYIIGPMICVIVSYFSVKVGLLLLQLLGLFRLLFICLCHHRRRLACYNFGVC